MKSKILFVAVMILSVSACNESSTSNSEDGDNSDSELQVGYFVAPPTKGLRYVTETESGYTDNQGSFLYRDGEVVRFYIGALELGASIGSEFITPVSLTGEDNQSNLNNKAVNISRTLQTIDVRQDTEAVIIVPDELQALDIQELNFDYQDEIKLLMQTASNLAQADYMLKDFDAAKDLLARNLRLYANYPVLRPGSYSIGEARTIWYLMSMPADGNVIISTTNSGGSTGARLYDLHLNPVDTKFPNRPDLLNYFPGSHPVFLESGKYLVEVKYLQGTSTTFNSSVVLDQMTLPRITVGTYSSTSSSAEVRWYFMSMPADGNIVMSTTNDGGSTGALIYDIELNRVNTNFPNRSDLYNNIPSSYPVFLEAGYYVFEIHHRQSGSVTVNSPLL